MIQPPAATRPEREHDLVRKPELGYQPLPPRGQVRYVEHDASTPLVRWHYHDEYELHLIVETHGRVFVGDYVGYFEPGHLVLTGPRLPHNWVSSVPLPEGQTVRDMVVQFPHAPLHKASELLPELRDLQGLLDRSRFGIEFFGQREAAFGVFSAIRDSTGVRRLTTLLQYLDELARSNDYRLLSSAALQSSGDATGNPQMGGVVDHLIAHSASEVSASGFARQLNMSESNFARQFRRTTGATFSSFVNQLRVNRACQLLAETDKYISTICYEVGFTNLANFNRRFLDIKGSTPSQYRAQAKAGLAAIR